MFLLEVRLYLYRPEAHEFSELVILYFSKFHMKMLEILLTNDTFDVGYITLPVNLKLFPNPSKVFMT